MADQSTTPEPTPTRKEVENLKTIWVADPNWDLYETEGYEIYRDELKKFQTYKEDEWRKKGQQLRENRVNTMRQQWFELNLNDSFSPEKHITITRVPGGWVMESGLRETLAMTFIPYCDEFKGE